MKKQKESVSNPLFDTDISIKEKKKNGTKHSKSNSKSSNTDSSNISNKINNKNNKKVRKLDADSTKVDDKSKSKSTKESNPRSTRRKSTEKSNTTNTKIESQSKIEEKKIKVGRKTSKNNWWNGCDYVWVDGIDHWVAKSAFRNEDKNNPVYTLQNYVQGLDSFWVMRYKPGNFMTESEKALIALNSQLKTKFKNWEEVSKYQKLKEDIIEKYKDHIIWYYLLIESEKNNREFSDKFKKKFSDKFKLYAIIK